MQAGRKTQRIKQLWENIETGKHYYISDKGFQKPVKPDGLAIPKFLPTITGTSNNLRSLKNPESVPRFPGKKDRILKRKENKGPMSLSKSLKNLVILSPKNKIEFKENSKI